MNFDISGIDLSGQVAIVTGSGYGLNRSIAQALEAAGAAVTLIVKTERAEMIDLVDQSDERVSVVVVDTANRSAVERTVENFRDQNGFITLVVNITDIAQMPGPLWQIDPGEWSNTLEANLRRLLLWTKAALPEMVSGGRIINIADSLVFSRLMDSLTAEARAREIAIFSIDSSTDSDIVNKLILFLASGRADNLSGHYVRVDAPTIEIEPGNALRLHS